MGGKSPGAEGAAEHSRFLHTRSFGSLDGLRALSILAVVWHHSMSGGQSRWPLVTRGFLGVDLFFVISGFLIVTLLLRERRRTGTISLRSFYVRRILRIFPAYYAMLCFVAALTCLKPGSASASVRHDLPYALFYLSNLFPMQSLIGITWSLSVEEQFYIVMPTLQKYARRILPLLLASAYVLAALPPFGLFPQVAFPAFFRETTFGPILLGVMLAHALDDPRVFARFHQLLGHRHSPLIALTAAVAICCVPAPDISGWPRIAIHFSLVLLVTTCVVREDHVLKAPLSLWLVRRIGIVSYGIYLFHMLVRHIVVKAMDRFGTSSELIRVSAVALGSWLVAELSYRWFESRFLRLKTRYSH